MTSFVLRSPPLFLCEGYFDQKMYCCEFSRPIYGKAAKSPRFKAFLCDTFVAYMYKVDTPPCSLCLDVHSEKAANAVPVVLRRGCCDELLWNTPAEFADSSANVRVVRNIATSMEDWLDTIPVIAAMAAGEHLAIWVSAYKCDCNGHVIAQLAANDPLPVYPVECA